MRHNLTFTKLMSFNFGGVFYIQDHFFFEYYKLFIQDFIVKEGIAIDIFFLQH